MNYAYRELEFQEEDDSKYFSDFVLTVLFCI